MTAIIAARKRLISHSEWALSIVSAITLMVSVWISFVLPQQVVRPLMSLKEAVDHAAAGNYEIEFEIRGEGEVVQLANSIRLLISHVKERYEGTISRPASIRESADAFVECAKGAESCRLLQVIVSIAILSQRIGTFVALLIAGLIGCMVLRLCALAQGFGTSARRRSFYTASSLPPFTFTGTTFTVKVSAAGRPKTPTWPAR